MSTFSEFFTLCSLALGEFWYKRHFDLSPVANDEVKGKVAIVTGANTGIGRICALELARRGAHVIMACRSEERTKPAIESIEKELAKSDGPVKGKVEFMALDLSSLATVDAFCDAFEKRKLPIHILLNNAGVMAIPKLEKTKDGIEMQFGTNHVGHFALTTRLLPIIENSAPARIVNVSSQGHRLAPADCGIPFDGSIESQYTPFRNYGISKLANILFSRELSDRFVARGIKNIYVNSLHPGSVSTELGRHLGVLEYVIKYVTISPEQGALTSLYLALSPEVVEKDIHARYFCPFGAEDTPSKWADNKELAENLWSYTEKIIGEARKAFTK